MDLNPTPNDNVSIEDWTLSLLVCTFDKRACVVSSGKNLLVVSNYWNDIV